mmetsp:Transcript_16948/g.48687  ORF Transcript_16948/g.48687 Transcript_16948/m.48687 type:complete len:462 (+) Transcript_16948:174-1559(+)
MMSDTGAAASREIPAEETTMPTSTAAGAAEDPMADFAIWLRLDSTPGAPIERFLLNNLAEKTYECLVKEAIQRTFPDKEVTPSDVGDYIVSLKDCLDEWEIDVKTTEDLNRAIGEHGNKTMHRLKVSATVRRRDDVKEAMKKAILAFMKTKGMIDEAVMDETIRATGFTREFILSRASSTAKIPVAVPITPKATFDPGAKLAAAAAATPVAKPTAVKAKSTSAKYALPTKARRKSTTATSGKAKGSVKERILGALGQLHAIGIAEAPRIQLALWSGYSNVNSAGFAKALSQTKKEGHIQYPSGKAVSLTDSGRQTEAAMSTVPPKDNAAVHAQIKSLLKPIQIRMFDLLADGAVQTREDLAAGMGYTNLNSAGYAKSLSGMSSLGLIHYPKDATDNKKKLVQLSSICFPFKETAAMHPDDRAFFVPTPPLATAVIADRATSFGIPHQHGLEPPPLPMPSLL